MSVVFVFGFYHSGHQTFTEEHREKESITPKELYKNSPGIYPGV